MATEFGKFCRILRIQQGEVLKDMALKLNVTSSYLSAVETGKREVPTEWFETISNMYRLTLEQQSQFRQAIDESKKELRINMESYSNDDKNIVLAFARTFEQLDEISKEKLIKIFNREE